MEKKMKKISFLLIIASLFLISAFTAYKVVTQHNHNIMLVSEKRIVEAAKRCLNEDNCEGNKITLAMLYTQKYLEQEINPLTKEIYNENSYVLVDENKFIIVN